ncbi:hypothetical protein EV193_101946 [Herbihabitans rhizosphaerae]|uniref:FtsX-like permease family protein n=1 Tax=Herbihabitans rhizosphaerae TaxID=1872711 RepID=A0A4Q7L9E9_9PSEU|nr:hypothetical protein [Herbihabitans rhizosphaerae]RZS45062.1 hypothetical protein EV193_101946 [Herbihabitans rhizosphaerae]
MNRQMRRARSRSFFRVAIAVPLVLKVACGAALIVLTVALWRQFVDLDQHPEPTSPWGNAQNYAVFHPRLMGDDRREFETGGDASTVAEARDLYPVLDKAGGLYVDSVNYQAGAPNDPSSPWPARPIRVNGNFLQQYPILDASGKKIAVPDDEKAWVVAVPERFKPREAQFKEYLRSIRASASLAEARVVDEKALQRFAGQEVRIIWTASGQEVFSFDPRVNPDRGNMITDPVVEIMTPANSLTVDRLNSITGGLDAGLKIRVDGDPAAVSAQFAPLLRQLRLDDNLRHLVNVPAPAGTQASESRDPTTQSVALAVGALLVMVLLQVTIVVTGSDRLRSQRTARRLLGSHRELLLVSGATWLVQTLIAAVVVWHGTQATLIPGVEVSPYSQTPKLLAVAVISLAIEALLLIVTARIMERRNAAKPLKQL